MGEWNEHDLQEKNDEIKKLFSEIFENVDINDDNKIDDKDAPQVTDTAINDLYAADNPKKYIENTKDDFLHKYDMILKIQQDFLKDRFHTNSTLKKVFFVFVMLLLLCSFIGSICLIIYLIDRGLDVNGVVSVVSIVAGMFASLLVLPKIMAAYLYPKNEEENFYKVLNLLMRNDSLNYLISYHDIKTKKNN